MTTHGIDSGTAGGDASDRVAAQTERQVRERPWLVPLAQIGWVAKGLVYLLFGVLAVQVARQDSGDDGEASPNGVLNLVMEQPGGRWLLGVLTVGLALYCLWRVLSVAVIRADDLSGWAHRLGYAFSAVFYGFLTYTAARAVQRGVDPESDNTVEKVSRSLMDEAWGRWLVGIGGVVTIVVALFFVVRKAIMRSFVDELHGVEEDTDDASDMALIVAGVVGWIGRGVVTGLVGFLVLRAAVTFDPDEARGFDGALRRAAESQTGTYLVWTGAVGLILYGLFCVFSHRYRRLQDDS